MDTIDDSVTGSFQQVDFNRHLEEISQTIESVLISYIQYFALSSTVNLKPIVSLLRAWEAYNQILDTTSCKIFSFVFTNSFIINHFLQQIQLKHQCQKNC